MCFDPCPYFLIFEAVQSNVAWFLVKLGAICHPKIHSRRPISLRRPTASSNHRCFYHLAHLPISIFTSLNPTHLKVKRGRTYLLGSPPILPHFSICFHRFTPYFSIFYQIYYIFPAKIAHTFPMSLGFPPGARAPVAPPPLRPPLRRAAARRRRLPGAERRRRPAQPRRGWRKPLEPGAGGERLRHALPVGRKGGELWEIGMCGNSCGKWGKI